MVYLLRLADVHEHLLTLVRLSFNAKASKDNTNGIHLTLTHTRTRTHARTLLVGAYMYLLRV